jgi:hypothetical protein
MKTHNQVNIAEILHSIKKAPFTDAIQIADDQILVKSRTRSQELVLVLITEPEDARIICNVPLKVPDYQYIDSLLITNTWNRLNESLDTYAYVSMIAESSFILLESYCLLTDGINSNNIIMWLQNLTSHIDSFEELVTSRLRSTEDWLQNRSLV